MWVVFSLKHIVLTTMSLNHVITLSSLQQKLKQAGYETIEQLTPIVISEITNGNIKKGP